MNVNGLTRRPGRGRTSGLVLLVLIGGLAVERQSCAAPTRGTSYVVPPDQVGLFRTWSRYLSRGPQTWSRVPAPEFSPAIRGTIWKVLRTDTQAQALANPMIDYLLWRQSLNPARFARNHPRLSPALTQLLRVPTVIGGTPPPSILPVPQSQVSPQTVTGPAPVSPRPQTIPQTVVPPAVPEPNSLLVAGGMAAWGLWWRRRLNRKTDRARSRKV